MEVFLLFVIALIILVFMHKANIICWNYRRISSKDTSTRVLHLIQKNRPMIICLVETRANSKRVDRFSVKTPRNWDWAALLADGFSWGSSSSGIKLFIRSPSSVCPAELYTWLFLLTLLLTGLFLLFIILITFVPNALSR